MFPLLIFIALFSVSSVSSYIDVGVQPCKDYDKTCVTNSAKVIYEKVIKGNPAIGLKGSDPMFKKRIEGNLLTLNYTVTNSTLTGFRQCEISQATFNLQKSILHYDLVCPFFSMVGYYDVNGVLLVVPIMGNGDFVINTYDYRIAVDIDIAFVAGKDDKKHLKFNSFKYDPDLRGGMMIDLRNLFNGNKELGDAVLKFMNQNWKPVSKFLEGPVINNFLKKLFSNFNKLFLHIPAEDLIIF